MTAQQYLDELKLRLNRMEVAVSGNDQLLMNYINRARRQVQGMTLDLFPERYAKIARFALPNVVDANSTILNSYAQEPINAYRLLLPDDLIDTFEVLIEWIDLVTGVTYRQQCRRLTKQEYWNVQMSAWSVPTIDRPTYTIEETIAPVKSLLLSGLNYMNGLVNTTLWDVATPAGVMVELWYTAIVPDIEYWDNQLLPQTDTEMSIPPDVDELITYYAMQYFLQNTTKVYAQQSVQAEIDLLFQMIRVNYETKQLKGAELLPSKEPLQGGVYAQNVGTNSQQG